MLPGKSILNRVLLFVVLAIAFTSCNEIAGPETNAPNVDERVDMKFEGAIEQYFYVQNNQSDESMDLITYEVSANQTEVAFELNIDEVQTLVIRATDNTTPYFWEINDNEFSVLAHSPETTYKFIEVEYKNTQLLEGVTFESNYQSASDQANTDAFRIVHYDYKEGEILCRIDNLQIVNSNDPDEIITVNGTFRGSILNLSI